MSQRPGVDDGRAGLLVHEDAVKDVERIDRDDTRYESLLRLAIESLRGKAAAIDLAAFVHEFREALIHEEVARKRLVAKRREAALETERHARSIEQDRGFIAFAEQPRGDERIHDPDRAFKGNGVKSDERFFAGVGLDVRKYFLLVVHE